MDPQAFEQKISQNVNFSVPKLRKLKVFQWLFADTRPRYFWSSRRPLTLSLFDRKISRYLRKLQALQLFTQTLLSDHLLFSSQIPLHQIQNLALEINSTNLPVLDFALLSKFSNLESLSLSFRYSGEAYIHDFSFLFNLKKFSFQTCGPIIASNSLQKNLPKLESLEIKSFGSSCSHLTFYKNLILKAPNIKTLKIFFPAQSLPELLEFDFSLAELSLGVPEINAPFIPFSKNLSAFLQKNSNLKSLQLYFHESYHDFLEPIMRSIQSLKGIESFKLELKRPLELKDCKIPLLSDVVTKLEGLKSIHLEVPDHIFDSKEVSSLANTLMKCERLEKLVLNAVFMKISDASFGKFMEFVRNAKGIKSKDLCIKGCSEEKKKQLEKALGYDISYWEDPFMKISTDRNSA